ncbi:MAG: ABC transporter substrate-binding protein [Euryarchaeota archaeon]|nr:ABC transporter substrate-binding protein [Euryarchaeota archaeon]
MGMNTTLAKIAMTMLMLALALPAAASDYTLEIFGNANEDETINMQDVTYTELILLEYRDETELADAKHDNKINMQDVTQIELAILGKEKELTLLDSADRVVTVKKPITRIMTYGQALHQIIRTLESEDRLVATDRDVQEVWSALFPEFVGLPIWGAYKERDYELIYELQPDIFITMVQAPLFTLSAVQQEDISKLEPQGIGVLALAHRHPAELLKTVRKLGYVLDRRDEAEEFIYFYSELMDTITERTGELPDDDKPRVYIANTVKYKTSGEGTAYSEYVKMAGGISISAEEPSLDGLTYVEIDPEWLIEQNPDVFVFRVGYNTIQGYGQDDASVAQEVQEDVLNTPELANVNAIRDEWVYQFGQATTASASFLCIGYMAKWFYPELFEDIDMEAMHQEYLDRFQRLDYDVDTQGVFMYPPLYGPALT